MQKFTFKRTTADAIDWKAELPRFRAARVEDETMIGDVADMDQVDAEIARRANSIAMASGCTTAQGYERFITAAKLEGTEERELLAAHFKCVQDMVASKARR